MIGIMNKKVLVFFLELLKKGDFTSDIDETLIMHKNQKEEKEKLSF